MANVLTRPGWFISEKLVTPEIVFRKRRKVLKELGFLGGAALLGQSMEGAEAAGTKKYPFARTKEYELAGLKLSDETEAATWNNFYEFSTGKREVHRLTGKFTIDPWAVEVDGLCEKPMKVDVRELIETMPMEERVYRFRCVEAWSMVVPWTGF